MRLYFKFKKIAFFSLLLVMTASCTGPGDVADDNLKINTEEHTAVINDVVVNDDVVANDEVELQAQEAPSFQQDEERLPLQANFIQRMCKWGIKSLD